MNLGGLREVPGKTCKEELFRDTSHGDRFLDDAADAHHRREGGGGRHDVIPGWVAKGGSGRWQEELS